MWITCGYSTRRLKDGGKTIPRPDIPTEAREYYMSTIFVVQENNRISYHPAEAYGELKFLTAREYSPTKGSLINEKILEDIRKGLENFDPSSDFLLLTGNPVMIGYVMHLCLNRKGYVKVLQWDRMSGRYIEIHFNPET